MPFKGCLSDACVLMKIERFVLKPLRKIERFVLKQHTFRFADYSLIRKTSLSCSLGNYLQKIVYLTNLLVAVSGNTTAGLNVLASSKSIIAYDMIIMISPG